MPMEAFADYLTGLGLSLRTIRLYVHHVTTADRAMLQANTSLYWASATQIADYTATNIPYAHSSRGQAAAAFGHYWEWKRRDRPPVKAVRVPPAPEMVCRAVNEFEARALAKTAIGWWPEGTAVLFGLYLALRRTEIAVAEWSRFDGAQYTVRGKYGKTATLPVHPILLSELEGRIDGRWVFDGRFGGHVSPATIWDWSKKVAAAKRANVCPSQQDPDDKRVHADDGDAAA